MSASRRLSAACLPILILLLGACAAPGPMKDATAPEQVYADRLERLAAEQTWGFTGRLGIIDGQDGGSGRLDWRSDEDTVVLQFRGALGQGAWQLESGPEGARLQLADDTVRVAPNVDLLVLQEVGWVLPVSALTWWVRGMAWPGEETPQSMQLNEEGTPAVIEQLGWRISYERYVEHAGEQLPSRLLARQGDTQVKLAISRWHGGSR